jgi:hypothetical protein
MIFLLMYCNIISACHDMIWDGGVYVTMIMQCFFFGSNLFVTKVTMIHLGKFSKIRVQATYENIFLETSFYILDTCLKFGNFLKLNYGY